MKMRWVVFWLIALALLSPALGLTVVRLVGAESGTAIRAESFTPLGLPLYTAALVVLLLGGWRRTAGRRTPMLAGALVALLGIAIHAWWMAPWYLGAAPAPAAGAQPVVVMTSNLYEGKGDIDGLLAAVAREDVDILVLEEISMPALAAADAGGLAKLLPYRIGGPNGYDPVSGTMVLGKEPLGTPTPVETYHDSWMVDVGDLKVLAVHPVAPVTPEQWRADHRSILAVARSARPDLILGDFNATLDHEPMRALDDAGFRDVGELANDGWQPTWPANGINPIARLPVPSVVRIDHVLVGSTLAAIGTHTVRIPGSDHLALVAEVAPR